MHRVTMRFCAIAFVCFASAAFASVTISGNLKDLTGTAVASRTFVRFTIRGCNGNQPRKAGTAIIVPSIYEFTPNASGVISGTLYDSLTDIECGGVVGATWYGVTIFRDGKPNPEVAYNVTGATFNLNSALPNTTNPVVAAPTGDSTYARLDGLNQPFTGNITAPSFIGSLTGNASTATSLAANGSNCTAGNYPLGVDASGNVENCTSASGGGVTSIATTSPITGGTITTTGTIAINNAAADGSTKGAASFTAADFDASSGNISLDYTNGQAADGTHKGFLTSGDWTTFNSKGPGSVTSVATTSPITGGSITTTGTIACATCVTSAATLTSGQLMAGAGSQASQVSNLSGDVTTSGALATTVAKVNGVAYAASPSTDTVPVITAANTATYKSLPDCQDTTGNHLNYTASTHTIGCGTSIPAVNNFAYGGSGLDSALAFDGVTIIPCASLAGSTYTLSRECYGTTITVSNGVTINTNNAGQCYILLATTSMSISGTIQSVGPAGGNAAGASGGATANQPCRGSGSARIGTQSAGGGTASAVGVSGALGGSGVGPNGSNGTATTSSGTANYCPAGASGTGTTGGSGGAGVSAGGNAGTGGAGGGTTPNTLANTINDGHTIWAWREPAGTQTFSVCYYGGAGSGGGAGGGNGTQSGGNGGSSGGGGAGGGVVFLSSPIITVAASGVISANGGNGGNGSNGANGQAGGGATGGGGGGAGGTGGPGGFVVLVYHTYTNSGSVTANGGSGGTLGTHGNGTSGGANGNDGNTGLAGKNGVVFQFAN